MAKLTVQIKAALILTDFDKHVVLVSVFHVLHHDVLHGQWPPWWCTTKMDTMKPLHWDGFIHRRL